MYGSERSSNDAVPQVGIQRLTEEAAASWRRANRLDLPSGHERFERANADPEVPRRLLRSQRWPSEVAKGLHSVAHSITYGTVDDELDCFEVGTGHGRE